MFLSPTYENDELARLYSDGLANEFKRENREVEAVTGATWAEFHGMDSTSQARKLESSELKRPLDLKRFIQKGVRENFTRVLDIGGTDGSLLKQVFPDSEIYVYDMNPKCTDPTVTYYSDIKAVASAAPFDFVGSFHTFEHIPDPAQALRDYRPWVDKGTILCIEVPMEYIGPFIKRAGIPLTGHVNYFTRTSLAYLARAHGYDVMRTSVSNAWYGEIRLPVIRGLFRFVGGEAPAIRQDRLYSDWLMEFTTDLGVKVIGKYFSTKRRG